jgi:polar amino acid transport system substrate-binding protein
MTLRKAIEGFLTFLALLVGAEHVTAQQPVDPRVSDVVRAGKVRVAMFPPQYVKLPTGELSGWAIDLARALGARLGVEAIPVLYPGPDKLLEALKAGEWDVGFLVNSPAWAEIVDFSKPFLQQDFTFLIPAGSSIKTAADVDRPGVRVAVVRGHGSTLALARILKSATAITAENLQGAFELVRDGRADAFASTRPQVIEDSLRLPGSAVLEDRYGVNYSVLSVPKGNAGRLSYVDEFLREIKASGDMQRAIERSGWRGVKIVMD